MAHPRLRELITSRSFVVAPGVYDMISALIADRMGFPALYVTGYGTVASALGLPDAGLATYSQMIEHIGQIAAASRTPVIADADTGYGGLLNVRHTVRGYERAGVTAIQLEDQEFPKKCGHTPDRKVIPLDDMVRKIQVASDSRSSSDFLIIARTDARTGLGLDEARISREVNKPLVANMVNGGRTPMLKAEELASLGYSMAIFPAVGFLSTAQALTDSYRDLQVHGTSTDAVRMFDFAAFNELIGFQDVWDFERRYSER